MLQFVLGSFLLCLYFRQGMTNCDKHEAMACISEEYLARLMDKRHEGAETRHAFFAFLNKSVTLNGRDVVKFDNVITNKGKDYDSSTGVFTAPKNALYQISCMILAIEGRDTHFQIDINDQVFGFGYSNKGYYASHTLTYLMELNKGDKVLVRHRGPDGEQVHGDRHSYFSGYLIQ